MNSRIEGQEQEAVDLKNLYDYCRKVEQELATFGFEEQWLAIEALGTMVFANGREWRMNARIPKVVEAETISSNCLQNNYVLTPAYHPPDGAITRAGVR